MADQPSTAADVRPGMVLVRVSDVVQTVFQQDGKVQIRYEDGSADTKDPAEQVMIRTSDPEGS